MGSVIVAATRGHTFFYELSHCVIPKELSPAAARQHVPRMWALDPAQRGEVQRGGSGVLNGANALARQPVTQLLLATVLVAKQPSNEK